MSGTSPHLLAPFTLVLLLAGCKGIPNSTPAEHQVGTTAGYGRPWLPALDPEKGRIYFYRPSKFPNAGTQRPRVTLNGNVVGEFKLGAFFFVDDVPGDKEVAVQSDKEMPVGPDAEPKLRFTLQRQEIRYVRGRESIGWTTSSVEPRLVDKGIGEREVLETEYNGSPEAIAISWEERERLKCEREVDLRVPPVRSGDAIFAIAEQVRVAVQADAVRRECLAREGLR
jgi:hypothetical protein